MNKKYQVVHGQPLPHTTVLLNMAQQTTTGIEKDTVGTRTNSRMSKEEEECLSLTRTRTLIPLRTVNLGTVQEHYHTHLHLLDMRIDIVWEEEIEEEGMGWIIIFPLSPIGTKQHQERVYMNPIKQILTLLFILIFLLILISTGNFLLCLFNFIFTFCAFPPFSL